jgi:hypothetical protein
MHGHPSIPFLTLNSEGHKHFDRILPFLEKHHFEVVHIQEIFLADVPVYEKVLGAKGTFLPLVKVTQPNSWGMDPLGEWGIATFTSLPVVQSSFEYYVGSKEDVHEMIEDDASSYNRTVLWQTVEKDSEQFTFAHTHFTWSNHGQPTDEQRRDYQKMQNILDRIPEFVLCGDMNSPRGTEIFDRMAQKYKDNVPAKYTSTIDPELHRQKDLELMIDGIFSTPEYEVTQVERHCGVSDHCGLSGVVSRK